LNIVLLKKHIAAYKEKLKTDPDKHTSDLMEREERSITTSRGQKSASCP